MSDRLLLCTDMDRTVIPNGRQPENRKSREQFRQLCRLSSVCLVYVTGRHLQLVIEAITKYNLPQPGYAITDVGTKMYQRAQGAWNEMFTWQDLISRDWQGRTHFQLQNALCKVSCLSLQEDSKQSDLKLSYYLPLDANSQKVLLEIEGRLAQMGVEASVIWSVDEPEQVGLIDILPRNATKLHAIEFLQQHLRYEPDEIVFAGDSGNDLPVLGSSVRSILVANAESGIKDQAVQLVEQNGYPETLYIAKQENYSLGGNYAAGVLQGVAFFAPHITEKLIQK